MRVTDLPPSRAKPFRTSFLDAASKLGLVGAFDGPEDLARRHAAGRDLAIGPRPMSPRYQSMSPCQGLPGFLQTGYRCRLGRSPKLCANSGATSLLPIQGNAVSWIRHPGSQIWLSE